MGMKYGFWIYLLLGLPIVAVAAGVSWWRATGPEPISEPIQVPEARLPEVASFCAACHAYPPPEIFPKEMWRKEVKQAFDFYRKSNLNLPHPPLESVVSYYENHAPLEQVVPPQPVAARPCPIRFEKSLFRLPAEPDSPAVSFLSLAHLSDPKRLDVLVCDMRSGQILALRPYEPAKPWRVLGTVSNPGHAEVVDLDGDGIKDLLVADLGNFKPTDEKVGRVVWLRGEKNGNFKPITLLENVGRVADVQIGDFRKSGKLDLIVAVFGWRKTGEVLYLENHTDDWTKPRFSPRVIDDRHGAIHVPVGDLNKDGNLDFVTVFSQEHEIVVAFLGKGDGTFKTETIYAAPHPAYGSSGIQLVDLNQDGNLDLLYTNGDVLDSPATFKPYHGVQWLENRGTFPFTHHPLAVMPGAHRAVAVDADGDGDLDIFAVNLFPPPDSFPKRKDAQFDSVILLEQTKRGEFERHSLEKGIFDHVACAAGDIFGDGRTHLIVGNFSLAKRYTLPAGVTVWKNVTPAQK